MRTLETGFTLVELMIVVAIIGILTTVALPAFQDYTVRAKMSEVILAMSACRTPVTELYQSGGTPPGANNWGCEGTSSRYLAALATDDDGVVTATVTGIHTAINGRTVTLAPMRGSSAASVGSDFGIGVDGWVCGGAGTSIDSRYLPGSCRGR